MESAHIDYDMGQWSPHIIDYDMGQWSLHISIMTWDKCPHISIITWDNGVRTYRYDDGTMESAHIDLCGTMESAHIDYDMGQRNSHISIMTWDKGIRTYRL